MDYKEYSLNDAYFSLDDVGTSTWTSGADDIMKKSNIGEAFETLKQLPNIYKKNRRTKKPVVAELPEEVQRDLKVLKMRAALDPKHFYKRSSVKGPKNNVQVGVVLDSPTDFYNSRLPNKLRKNTLVDELLADAKFKKNIKKRYVQIIEEKKYRYKHKHRTLEKRKSYNERQSAKTSKNKNKKSSKKFANMSRAPMNVSTWTKKILELSLAIGSDEEEESEVELHSEDSYVPLEDNEELSQHSSESELACVEEEFSSAVRGEEVISPNCNNKKLPNNHPSWRGRCFFIE